MRDTECKMQVARNLVYLVGDGVRSLKLKAATIGQSGESSQKKRQRAGALTKNGEAAKQAEQTEGHTGQLRFVCGDKGMAYRLISRRSPPPAQDGPPAGHRQTDQKEDNSGGSGDQRGPPQLVKAVNAGRLRMAAQVQHRH